MKLLKIITLIVVLVAFLMWKNGTNGENVSFPAGFLFGVSTSAYQIEGAWNEEGKGENIWDKFTHSHPERIMDRSNGDKSCDSYHNYKEDINMLKFLGVHFYRFSISWSRIFPTGFSNEINFAGVKYYNNLINELLANRITPMVTLYHWDLPQPLQDLGGWTNLVLADFFTDYARFVFEQFGDRVKLWLTFNEPKLICVYGYGDVKMAPGVNATGIGEYLCGHTILHAHAKVYRMYHENYIQKQYGKVGISLHSEWFEPYSKDERDLEAAERKLLFDVCSIQDIDSKIAEYDVTVNLRTLRTTKRKGNCNWNHCDFGWFGQPIFHGHGDYPTVMKKSIDDESIKEGFERSRLPVLDQTSIDLIRGTYDFLGLNMYTASMVAHHRNEYNVPSYQNDIGVQVWKDPNWKCSNAKRLKVVPWTLQSLLNWIRDHYGNITIIITENGFADEGEIDDYDRMNYINDHLYFLLRAIYDDGIPVIGYSAWTLMDNFEWFGGYKERYGLFHVDFSDRKRPRHPKKSAFFYKEIIETRTLDWPFQRDNAIVIPSNILFIPLFMFTIVMNNMEIIPFLF